MLLNRSLIYGQEAPEKVTGPTIKASYIWQKKIRVHFGRRSAKINPADQGFRNVLPQSLQGAWNRLQQRESDLSYL